MLESLRYLTGETCILDLFAGSGAFAFEALSRGAKFVYLNDLSRVAVNTCAKNAEHLSLNREQYVVRQGDALKFSTYKKISAQAFDVVFIDPPYAFSDKQIDFAFKNLIDNALLTDNAIIVVESAKLRQLSQAGFNQIQYKKYGDTVLQFYANSSN